MKKESINLLKIAEELKEFMMKPEEVELKAKKFKNRIAPLLKKEQTKMYPIRSGPNILAFSSVRGPYLANQPALYINWNTDKYDDYPLAINELYLSIEKRLIASHPEDIEWRTNLFIDTETNKVNEVEFIPMAFRGSYLLKVLKEYPGPILDFSDLLRATVEKTGEIMHNILIDLGYSSSYPHIIEDIGAFDIQEIKETDIYIELRYISKNIPEVSEGDIMKRFPESPLERIIGLELIKEGIPFLLSEEIKLKGFDQEKDVIIAKPDFLIGDESPIAIYCDSKKYHVRKKDQLLKDQRIDRKLQLMGYSVLRFYEEEINKNPRACVEEIKKHMYGLAYGLSKDEIILEMIDAIEHEEISEWEAEFIKDLKNKLQLKKPLSIKDERIFHQILMNLEENNKRFEIPSSE